MITFAEWYKWRKVYGHAEEDRRYTIENGFEDKDEAVLSFVDGTRTFTIAPVGSLYFVWCGGARIPKTVAESIVIPDVEGLYYVYFGGTGVLAGTAVFSEDIILRKTFVAAIYWDATNNTAVLVGDERHGRVMDSQTHLYHHQTEGAKWASGLAPYDVTIGNGNLASHAQLGVGAGTFWDEDLHHIVPIAETPASIPFLYRLGANGDWRTIAATGYIGTNVAPGQRLAYNQWTGATWQLAQVANGDFVLMHLIATNDVSAKLRWVVGQNDYTTLNNAQAGAATEWLSMSMGALSILTPEFVIVATFILRTGTGYNNAVKGKIVLTDAGGQFIDWRRAPTNAPGVAAVPVGAGQMYGNADTKGIFYNAQTISEDITVLAGHNAMSAGPITVSDGFSVTVSDGSVWVIT